jgi:hypothetical protein
MTPAERDAAILEHLKRYHLTTPEVLHRLFFPGVGLNAVRKVTGRLVRERRIRPCSLFDQRKYFILTPREAVRLGEHRSVARKFEYQGLVNAYGVLSYCVQTGTKKFTPKEFREQFPELVIPGVRLANYYIDIEETPEGRKSRLGFMLVDYGTSEQTILKKLRKIAARGFTLPDFTRLIQRGNFVNAIIAPTVAKAEAIKAALLDEAPGFIRYRVEAVEELGELLVHRGRLRGARPEKRTTDEDDDQADADARPAAGETAASRATAASELPADSEATISEANG